MDLGTIISLMITINTKSYIEQHPTYYSILLTEEQKLEQYHFLSDIFLGIINVIKYYLKILH